MAIFRMLIWVKITAVVLLLAANVVAADENELVLGIISSVDTDDVSDQAEKQVSAAASAMIDIGVSRARLHKEETVQGMLVALQQSEVDWFSGELFHALILSTKIPSDIYLYNRDHEVEKFHSVFFMRKASNVKGITELDRKIVVFNNSFSTAEYFVPYYVLTEKDYSLSQYGAKDGKERRLSDKRRVYYLFDSSRKSMVKKVLLSDNHVGVMDSQDYEKLSIITRKKLQVIYRTHEYPRQVELVRNNLDFSMKQRLRQVLHNSDVGTSGKEKPTQSGAGRFQSFVAEGKDGFYYLKNLVKHKAVPFNLAADSTEHQGE